MQGDFNPGAIRKDATIAVIILVILVVLAGVIVSLRGGLDGNGSASIYDVGSVDEPIIQ